MEVPTLSPLLHSIGQNKSQRECVSDPVVRTHTFTVEGVGSIPAPAGNWDPASARCGQKKTRQFQRKEMDCFRVEGVAENL